MVDSSKNITDYLSLLVGTCDSYEFLWDNFKTLETKAFNFEWGKYASCETKNFGESYITVNKDTPVWSDRILQALDMIPTKYVFFVLEDYYFFESFTETDIQNMISYMEEDKLDKLIFIRSSDTWPYNFENIGRDINLSFDNSLFWQLDSSDWLTSVQPAIWNKDYFKKVLKNGWSPWDFEVIGSEERKGQGDSIVAIVKDYVYFNACRKGKVISQGWEELRIENNLKEFNM